MPSAASSLFPQNATTTSPWREVQTAYRRICVLRATGKIEEASRLEASQLTPSVAALRDSSNFTQAQLDSLFTTEEERVANAHVLAEILLPMLIAASASLPQSLMKVAAVSQPTAQGIPAAGFAPERGEAAAVGASAPGIADFIDEMLSQERTPRSSRRSA